MFQLHIRLITWLVCVLDKFSTLIVLADVIDIQCFKNSRTIKELKQTKLCNNIKKWYYIVVGYKSDCNVDLPILNYIKKRVIQCLSCGALYAENSYCSRRPILESHVRFFVFCLLICKCNIPLVSRDYCLFCLTFFFFVSTTSL